MYYMYNIFSYICPPKSTCHTMFKHVSMCHAKNILPTVLLSLVGFRMQQIKGEEREKEYFSINSPTVLASQGRLTNLQDLGGQLYSSGYTNFTAS